MEVSAVASELRAAARDLRERGLSQAAKFASELLLGVPDELRARAAALEAAHEPAAVADARQAAEDDRFQAARASLDVGEFLRAHHLLSSGLLATRAPAMHKTRFLKYYALFLAGEKAKEERALEMNVTGSSKEMDRNLHRQGVNPHLKELHLALSTDYQRDALDAFGLYLFAVVLRRLGYTASSSNSSSSAHQPMLASFSVPTRTVLIESIRQYPWNWSAWMELAAHSPFTSSEEDVVLSASCPWMFQLFQAHTLLDQQQNDAACELLDQLAEIFPQSTYLMAQQALTSYHMRDFDLSQDQFERLASADPHRMEHMDVYSNVLYVKEDKTELSRLAHRALKVEKYRPETCCIIGNYYSIKGKHDRAIVYFHRALKLDPNFLSAWTLIGHEYVEMKNTSAAIEAYRHAVDLNDRDYRAWYGLGQAYEILSMFLYSIYYYRKAAAIRPYDPRMWCALGGCYDQLNKADEAIACFQRAVANQDREGIASYHLGRIYEQRNDPHEAAKYYQVHLGLRKVRDGNERAGESKEDHEGNGVVVLPRDGSRIRVDTQEALAATMFLGNYYKQLGRYTEATIFCNRLLDVQGPEHEEAKALLREMRSLEAMDANLHQKARPSSFDVMED